MAEASGEQSLWDWQLRAHVSRSLARSADEVQQTVDEIGQNNQIALGVPADVTDPEEVGSALAKIGDQWGPVEMLVNNAAAVWPLGPSATLDLQEWVAALTVNVTAPVRLSFNVLTGMLDRRWGRIVNVSSSIAANPTGMPRANAYVTSKRRWRPTPSIWPPS